jgi:hypothetical protein
MIIKNIKEWIKATYITMDEYMNDDNELIPFLYGYIKRPTIVCTDDFSFSAQGGIGSYSDPREFCDNYKDLEIGFPTNFDDPEFSNNDGQICSYVTIEDIQKVIERHGYIDVEKSGILGLKYNNAKKYKREEKLKRIINI